MADPPKRLAVLIDGDNAPAAMADALFAEIARFGEASVRRVYGDFANGHLGRWADAIVAHAVAPVHTPALIKGKNASDIALVIDAMDLLHRAAVTGFCLISSDCDYTRLAIRLREGGAEVIGFGEAKTPASLRSACNRFVLIENLNSEELLRSNAARPVSEAVAPIKAAIEANASADGWANLSIVGQHLRRQAPDFDPRTFGFAQLSRLVEKTGRFALRHNDAKGCEVRVKPVKQA